MIVSIDGALVAPEHATISVLDRGLLYGDGCFEVVRTWGSRVPDLDAHLDRLLDTAAALAMQTPTRDELRGHVEAAVAAAGEGDHRIRIVLTRGPGALSVPFAELGRGRAIVIVEPLPPPPRAVSIAIVDWPIARHGPGRKTLAYLDPLIARELARASGADEAIRLDHEGRVIEGATCNVFAVLDGVVCTPAIERGALPGIVRERVLAACVAAGIPCEVREITVADLRRAEEVFVTSSLRGVVPVTHLDGESRRVGPVTGRVTRAYLDRVAAVI